MIYGVTCATCNALVDDLLVGQFLNRKYLIDADGKSVLPHVVLKCRCGRAISEYRIVSCLLAITRGQIKASKEPPT